MRLSLPHPLCCILAMVCVGCASIPEKRYGLDRLQFEGTEEMDPDLIEPCLATTDRERLTLSLKPFKQERCGEPPFERAGGRVELFAWPWKKWPVYDSAVFELDLERIERWYKARGYYDARVLEVDYSESTAARSDRADCPEGCELDIRITVHEGKPVTIRSLELKFADDDLSSEVKEQAREVLELEVGDRWDEARYEQAEQAVTDVLREIGYARAKVEGDVLINRALRAADITMEVHHGPLARYGPVRVESASPVPEDVILAAAGLREGEQYQHSDLDDAQRAVYALGSFSAVTVRGNPKDLAHDDHTIPIVIEVAPRREREIFVGGGIMSGVLTTGPRADEEISVPQWDAHLIGRYEHRNFFGGLRKFRIEERPRLIFLGVFPKVPSNSPRFGNVLSARFEQPGVPEARTTLFVDTSWDYGPDPFQLFFRHDFDVALGLRRAFFSQRLHVSGALHQAIMRVSNRQPIVEDVPSSYRLPFVEEKITLDLREKSERGTGGGLFKLSSQQAALLWGPGWNYVRVHPEARGYAPLGLGITLAARFGVGSMHILKASSSLDAEAQQLGPQTYRERGGGAQGNRGFAAGRLGDSINGGIRSWLASLELRVPLGESFSLAAFTDMGDVNGEPSFRWAHLNTAVGGGIRYDTLLGPIRFDVGYRPRSLQRADGSEVSDPFLTDLGFTKFRGAMHLTIGDAF